MSGMASKIMRAIARIADSDRYLQTNRTSKILPLLRILIAFLCILLCALSRNAVFVIGVLAVLLLRLAFLPARRILHVLGTLLLPVLFALLLTLPAVFMGHPGTMLTIAMKVLESVLVLALLGEDLSWKEVTAAFQTLHFPQIFLLTLDLTVRFLVILGKYSGELAEAVQLRSFPDSDPGHLQTISSSSGRIPSDRKSPGPVNADSVHARRQRDRTRMSAAGGVLGTAFLKSVRLSEETYEAMACRCFDGTYRTYTRHKLCLWDLLYALLIPLLLLCFWYTQRAMGMGMGV